MTHPMQEQQQNAATPEEPTTPEKTTPEIKHETVGPLVGVAVIVIIIALGGYYMWSTQIRNGTPESDRGVQMSEDEMLTELETQSSSDSLSSIEGDLDDTELNTIDQELTNLDAELRGENF